MVKEETAALKKKGLLGKDHVVVYLDKYVTAILNEEGQITSTQSFKFKSNALAHIREAGEDSERIMLSGSTGFGTATTLYRSATESSTINVKDVYTEDGFQYTRRRPRMELLTPRANVEFTILHEYEHNRGVTSETLADQNALKKLNYPGY